jgi:hypothetical protein
MVFGHFDLGLASYRAQMTSSVTLHLYAATKFWQPSSQLVATDPMHHAAHKVSLPRAVLFVLREAHQKYQATDHNTS